MRDAADRSRGKWRFMQFVAVFSAAMLCILQYTSRFPMSVPYGASGFFGRRRAGNARAPARLDNQVHSPCSSLPDHAICCDRSDENTDVCFMSGDVRTDAASLSLLLLPPPAPGAAAGAEEERIRPYTRKGDGKIIGNIQEVRLRVAQPGEADAHRCDVRHDAPVHVVTAGGYNFNYFHAFNDGFLPSWVTVQHLRRRVVLAVLSYSPRWGGAYREVISGLSRYPVIDLMRDRRTHCFPGAIVGSRFHGYLAVDPARLRDNKTILDFHRFLVGLYQPLSSQSQGGSDKPAEPESAHQHQPRRPRLGILSRRGSRVMENRVAVAQLAASVGFDVDVLESGNTWTLPRPLPALYAWVRAHDALVGVHGSDLTNLLFLRPGSGVLAQIVPLGVTQYSRNLFGTPAVRMGLHYEQYDVRGHESSLSCKYSPEHVVVADPERAKRRQGSTDEGDWDWDFIGRVYLDGQNVSLDLARFRETLARMHARLLQQRQRDVTLNLKN